VCEKKKLQAKRWEFRRESEKQRLTKRKNAGRDESSKWVDEPENEKERSLRERKIIRRLRKMSDMKKQKVLLDRNK